MTVSSLYIGTYIIYIFTFVRQEVLFIYLYKCVILQIVFLLTICYLRVDNHGISWYRVIIIYYYYYTL